MAKFFSGLSSLLGDTNQAESCRTRTKAAKKEITKTSNWYKEKETRLL
jgi:hypothetical protein